MIFEDTPYFPEEEKLKGKNRKAIAYAGMPMSSDESAFNDDSSLDQKAYLLTTNLCADYSAALGDKSRLEAITNSVSTTLINNSQLLPGVFRNLEEIAQLNPETSKLINSMRSSIHTSLSRVAEKSSLQSLPLTQERALDLITSATANSLHSKYSHAILKGLLSREPKGNQVEQTKHVVETSYLLAEVGLDDGDAAKIAYVLNILCSNSDITIGNSANAYRLNFANGFLSANNEIFKKYSEVELFCDWYGKLYTPDNHNEWRNKRKKAVTKMLDADPAYNYIIKTLQPLVAQRLNAEKFSLVHPDTLAFDDSSNPFGKIETIGMLSKEIHACKLLDTIPDHRQRAIIERRLAALALFYGDEDSTALTEIPDEERNVFPYNVISTNIGPLREMIYADYGRFSRQEGLNAHVFLTLPGEPTVIHVPDKKLHPEEQHGYFRGLVLANLERQTGNPVLKSAEVATCINWLSPESLPTDLVEKKGKVANRLKIDFRRSISPRGTQCEIGDQSLRGLGYSSITYKFNGKTKSEYIVDVAVGNCTIRLLLDKNKKLLDPQSRKDMSRYGAYNDNTNWFEVMVLAHLAEITCNEAADLNINYGREKKTKEEEDTLIAFTRAGHLRRLGVGERAHASQYMLASDEQGWDLVEVNALRRSAKLPEVTYVKVVDKVTQDVRQKPVVYHAALKMEDVL